MKTQESTPYTDVFKLAMLFFYNAKANKPNVKTQFSIGKPPVSGIDKATLDLPK